MTKGEIKSIATEILTGLRDKIYPVGAIYMSTSSIDPSTFFGGTWERIQDKFLLAAGGTYTAGSTGGEATHTLASSEMPKHQHPTALFANSGSTAVSWTFGAGKTAADYKSQDGQGTGKAGVEFYMTDANYGAEENEVSILTGYSGGGQAHNNIPPYLAVYCWKRTA